MSQPLEDVRVRRDARTTQDGPATPPEIPERTSPSDVGAQDNAPGGRTGDEGLPPGFVFEQSSVDDLLQRLARLERRVRLQFLALVLALLGSAWLALDGLLIEDVVVRQRLMESRELTLLDNDGNARMFLRMYSKVPVLQLMDSDGRPRMSLGLRFDDTPFLDLSDSRGRTRASIEMTADDSPALRLFDENGTPTFNIN